MILSASLLSVILLGALVGAGVALLLQALFGGAQDTRIAEEPGRLTTAVRDAGRRLPYAIGAGLVVLLLTRWLVAALALGALVLMWDRLFGGGRAEKQGIARIEGLAAWTESLRDTVAGAVGLEQAIPATAYAASPAIRAELTTLSERLRVRMPLPEALKRFAEDLDDASADLVIAALILNSRLRGPGLRDVLTSLARSARLELEMRQRVNAGRGATRRSVQIVVGITIAFVVGLALFNRDYVEPYGTPFGQIMLMVILGVFAAGVLWLRSLAKFDAPERFLRYRREETVR